MSGPQDLWTTTADAFTQRYDAIGEHWDDATPCSDWTVRDLVDHVCGGQAMFSGALGVPADADAGWPAIRNAMAEAIAAPGALDGDVENPMLGKMPRQQVLGIAIGDLLIHTWDLSRAIGADDTLPAEAVPAVYQALQGIPAEFLRAPGRFEAAIEPPDGADPQSQLLLYSGRQV